MSNYVLVVQDKKGCCSDLIYGTDSQKLKYQGMDIVASDRKHIIANVYHYDNGQIGLRTCDCNLLLESYEGD